MTSQATSANRRRAVERLSEIARPCGLTVRYEEWPDKPGFAIVHGSDVVLLARYEVAHAYLIGYAAGSREKPNKTACF